jgi:protein involved in polysaccharide export with SLBB domain
MSSLPRRFESYFLPAAVGLLLIGAGSGCGKPTNGIGGLPAIRSERAPVVTLAPGDVVDIKFFYVPELNESQAVRPDGRIALQLVGEVEAQGRTPEQLREDLYRLYTPHLNKPDVTVIIRSFHGRRVLVGGEVKRPGMVEMPGPLTALEAIMQAGGFDESSARISNVVVIRHKGGQRYGASLDFRDALKGKESVEFLLEPLDIVYVPRTKIVKVAQWIDQHINQLIPMFGVEYSYPAGEGTVTIDTTRTRPLR